MSQRKVRPEAMRAGSFPFALAPGGAVGFADALAECALASSTQSYEVRRMLDGFAMNEPLIPSAMREASTEFEREFLERARLYGLAYPTGNMRVLDAIANARRAARRWRGRQKVRASERAMTRSSA